MSIITFKSFDNKFFVEFNDIILKDIQNKCIKANSNETGGILIGNYSDNSSRAIINCITGPPKDSKQEKFRFKRGIVGLVDLLDNKWNLGDYYIGEWHFHPNSSSQPSMVDNEQMNKLSLDKSLNCPEPILLVIGGNRDYGWRISLNVYQNGNRITLLS